MESVSDEALPEGWASYWDPERQRTYYYHAAAKRSTWKRPVLSTPAKRRLASTRDNIRTASSSSLASSTSPGVWKKSFSPEHNREYFYNRATGESRWRSPSSVSSDASLAVATTTVITATAEERDREDQLRQRLARSQAVVAQSKLALEQLEHTRAQLRIDREAKVAQAQHNGEVTKIWALAMLFCLAQLLLQKL